MQSSTLQFANNYEIVLKALQFTSEEIKNDNDNDKVLDDVKRNILALKNAPDNKKIALAAVKQNGKSLKYASKRLKEDIKIVSAAVSKCGLSLKYASKELQNNREIVLAAVSKYGLSLKYASKELQNNRKIVLAAVKINGLALEYVSKQLKNDKDIVFESVKQNGLALQYVNGELNNDIDIVSEAINSFGFALEYASNELQNNKEIVLAAVKKYSLALIFASPELKKDKEFLIECYKVNKNIIRCNIEFISSLNKIENNIFYNIEHFLNEHDDILHLIKNKNFYKYLLDNNKYEIIYKNEELHEYIKINYNILILSLNDLDPDNIYNKDKLKLEYKEKFKSFDLIFF
jgi:CxxC motif-containing protein